MPDPTPTPAAGLGEALLHWVPAARHADLADQLERTGYRIVEVGGPRVVDGASVLDDTAIALDEEIANWSSWGDIMRNHPALGDEAPSAIIWRNADAMVTHGLADLVTAVDILLGICRLRYSAGQLVEVFLIGEGPNFERYRF